MIELDVQFNKAQMEALTKGLAAMPRQLRFARARALRKTGSYIRTQIKKEAAKTLRIPQKSIADRFFLARVRPDDDQARLWIGTWNVDPKSIGNPVQNRLGVNIGRGRSYRGAFIGKIYSGTEKVWIRLRSKYYSPDLYPTRKSKSAGTLPAELRYRFPVVRAAVPIDGVMAKVFQRDESEIQERFRKTLLQEINYEVNVRGKK